MSIIFTNIDIPIGTHYIFNLILCSYVPLFQLQSIYHHWLLRFSSATLGTHLPQDSSINFSCVWNHPLPDGLWDGSFTSFMSFKICHLSYSFPENWSHSNIPYSSFLFGFSSLYFPQPHIYYLSIFFIIIPHPWNKSKDFTCFIYFQSFNSYFSAGHLVRTQ